MTVFDVDLMSARVDRSGLGAPALRPGRPTLIRSAGAYVIDMPGWRPIAKRVGTTLLLVSLLPMAVFYTTMSQFGLRTAVLAAVGWYYAGVVLNTVRRKPVLAASLLGAGLLSIRAVVTFVTGSAFMYFLQPVAGTVATATFFAATALAGRPVLDRLAHGVLSDPAGTLDETSRGPVLLSAVGGVVAELRHQRRRHGVAADQFVTHRVHRAEVDARPGGDGRRCWRVLPHLPPHGPASERLDPLGPSPVMDLGSDRSLSSPARDCGFDIPTYRRSPDCYI